MQSFVDIVGRAYVFLGYSHSSMRAQTVWFLHPFYFNGGLLLANILIKDLGNFNAIRSPAKSAARVGQCFSDTTESIRFHDAVEISDIERNGRCFTDGVGKISLSALRQVWEASAAVRKKRATLLQIRYRGGCKYRLIASRP